MNSAKETRSTVIPALSYRDPKRAVEWLCATFGFDRHAVYTGEDGGIEHAQLAFGNGMVMLGPVRDSEFGRQMAQPDQIGGRQTQTTYLVVADVDAHYAHAKGAGAEIVIDIKDEDYGGRDYTCRDPEGHMWTFGSYDPWAAG